MLTKTYNQNGQKAHQRADNEDRTLVYRNWLRDQDTDGVWFDLDLIKAKKVDGKIVPVAITELTRTDSETVSQKYLDAIIDRWFNRDHQAELIQSMATLLNVPAYLVLFPPSVSWFQVYSFSKKQWKEFTPQAWASFLKNLTT